MELKFVKLNSNAYPPFKATEQAAGFDLKSIKDYIIPAKMNLCIDTGLQILVPEGCYERIAPRSGLALNHYIDVMAGVIDRDYRGEVKVLLINHGKKSFKISKGDKIAQLIFEKICTSLTVEEVKKLDETDRGAGGFGSTGKK